MTPKIFAISLDASVYPNMRYWWVSVHRGTVMPTTDATVVDFIPDRRVRHYHNSLTPSSVARVRRAQEKLMQREVIK